MVVFEQIQLSTSQQAMIKSKQQLRPRFRQRGKNVAPNKECNIALTTLRNVLPIL
jgi:hypothetical protein